MIQYNEKDMLEIKEIGYKEGAREVLEGIAKMVVLLILVAILAILL